MELDKLFVEVFVLGLCLLVGFLLKELKGIKKRILKLEKDKRHTMDILKRIDVCLHFIAKKVGNGEYVELVEKLKEEL